MNVLLQYKRVQQKHWLLLQSKARCEVLETCHFCSSYDRTIKWCAIYFGLKRGLCLARSYLGLTSLWKIPPVMCHLASCTSAGSIPRLVSSQPAVIKCVLKGFRVPKPSPFFLQTVTPLFSHDTVHQRGDHTTPRKSNNHSVLLFFLYLTKSDQSSEMGLLCTGQMLVVFFY